VLIRILKALAEETRLRILNLLYQGELCVGEIEALLGLSQSNVSRHLNRLLNAEIINFEKKSQYVYYKINGNTLKKYGFIREIFSKELQKLEICQKDLDKLAAYRKSGLCCDDLRAGKVF